MTTPLDAKLDEIAERYCAHAQRRLPQVIHVREKWSPCQCDRVLAALREAAEAGAAQERADCIKEVREEAANWSIFGAVILFAVQRRLDARSKEQP